MEVLMGCFFDEYFNGLERGFLCARYRRQMVAEYISTVIAGCRDGDGTAGACREAVLSAIRYHEKMMSGNSGLCLLGKHHDVLYVVAKLCYDWNLEDCETVASLLHHMFRCEGTFERLVGGAVFGVKMCQLVSGWKSDYNNREENVKAVRYFAEASARARQRYGGSLFVDVPLECCGRAPPLWAALQADRPDLVSLFLDHGARVDPLAPAAVLYTKRLARHSSLTSLPPDARLALSLVLRSVLSLHADHPLPSFLPDYAAAKSPPSLKHASKLALRESLADNFFFPYGQNDLQIPQDLLDYILLKYD